MSQTAAHLVDHVIPHAPVRQWVLSLPIALRLLLASQPQFVTPVLQVVQRVLTRHLLDHAGLKLRALVVPQGPAQQEQPEQPTEAAAATECEAETSPPRK